MADVKWIKIYTDIFNNKKIKQIEPMPEGDAIIVIWLKILCLAGNINDNGCIYLTEEVPYTEQMLSVEFNRPLTTIQLALRVFEQFGMIEVIDDILRVSNWERYQNIEGMEKIREQNRIRKRNQRNREKLLIEESHVMSRDSHATDIDIEEDKEKDIDIHSIIDSYNSICKSLPKANKLTDQRKRHIKAMLKKYPEDEIRKCFEMAEASDFLKGSTGFKASFDWLLNETNLNKVLEGNYENRKAKKTNSNFKERDDDFDAIAMQIMANQQSL